MPIVKHYAVSVNIYGLILPPPSIEVTYVQYEGNLLAGSGLRVISKPYVEDWEEKEESTDVWMGY